MKKFIEVSDVTDIQALINKGLAYKQHPLLDKTLGANKRVGLLFLNPVCALDLVHNWLHKT